jgi:hypothetical protein
MLGQDGDQRALPLIRGTERAETYGPPRPQVVFCSWHKQSAQTYPAFSTIDERGAVLRYQTLLVQMVARKII